MATLTQFVKAHLGAALAAAAAAVVIVGGIVLILVVGSGGTAASASHTTTTVTTVAPTGRRGGAGTRRQGVRGLITAISGDTWTVRTAAGATVTVVIQPSTTFGTPANPLAASDFSVGARIVVLGTRSASMVTATRITKAAAVRAGGTTTTVPAG